MTVSYAKTMALELLTDDKGAATTEYALVMIAMFTILLPSMAYYASRVQKLLMFVAELWNR
jgi:Flp pilus assembly pilin Flp